MPQRISPFQEVRPYFAILCLPHTQRILGTVLGTVESGRRYRGSMARITPIGDVLTPRPMVRPGRVDRGGGGRGFGSRGLGRLHWFVALRSRVAQGSSVTDLESAKDQASLFDTRFPTQSELPSPSAVDTSFK